MSLRVLAALMLASSPAAGGRAAPAQAGEDTRPSFSGIHPHLAFFNEENECGTGAVVPWAGHLWVITYAPHRPRGSTDKLYRIDPQLRLQVRPESVGGTSAARMIHPESDQLFIGPYAIDAQGQVRVIPSSDMPGRLTAIARHLHAPADKLYYATMEEGLYEVDVHSLEVHTLFADANGQADHSGPRLPGYHGKGLYSGQGRLVYANNGELSPLAQRRPDIESGVLAEWTGEGDWQVVRRNQFTEVSGPGGLRGNARPDSDPLWSIGWDHRSLILMVLDGGEWSSYRLPKASHCYDGAHGWNTEWPRIRDIGETDLLMTMHGMLWRFPRGFRPGASADLRPRSSILKVVGDFCRWNEQVVFGCDDTARAEFLNRRKAKGEIASPGQSQSNLWFVEPGQLDQLGPVFARGALWMRESVAEGTVSDPFLFGGFERRAAHLVNEGDAEWRLRLELDVAGSGEWAALRTIRVPAGGSHWLSFDSRTPGTWIRVVSETACKAATVCFALADQDARSAEPDAAFSGLAHDGSGAMVGGLIRTRGENLRSLHFAAATLEGDEVVQEAYYEMDAAARLRRVDDAAAHAWLKSKVAVPTGVLKEDAASLLYVDDVGQRFRLPRNPDAARPTTPLAQRVDREVCTERDLFHAGGTFYELPARNAGGFAKLRPIASHPYRITDYCSYRGLLVLAGVDADASADSAHVVRSDDGEAALWLGAVDDLWRLGRPRGVGGPWKDSAVQTGVPSDPYLLSGYDRKALRLSHDREGPVLFRVEVDLTGTGHWVEFAAHEVPAGETFQRALPAELQAYWIRMISKANCTATAQLHYD